MDHAPRRPDDPLSVDAKPAVTGAYSSPPNSPAMPSQKMMGPVEAVQSCLRKYATFSGRAPRAEYWWFTLVVLLAGFLSAFLDLQLWGVVWLGTLPILPLTEVLALALLLPGIAVAVRRLHDSGRGGPGWVTFVVLFQLFSIGRSYITEPETSAIGGILLNLVFIGAAIILLIQYVRPSQPEANRYGPPPYGETFPDEEVFR